MNAITDTIVRFNEAVVDSYTDWDGPAVLATLIPVPGGFKAIAKPLFLNPETDLIAEFQRAQQTAPEMFARMWGIQIRFEAVAGTLATTHEELTAAARDGIPDGATDLEDVVYAYAMNRAGDLWVSVKYRSQPNLSTLSTHYPATEQPGLPLVELLRFAVTVL